MQGDETQWVAADQTLHSEYNTTLGELELEQANATQRHKFCDDVSYDDTITPFNVTQLKRPSSVASRRKGEIITNFVNNHSDKPTHICTIVSGWTCRNQGLNYHPTSCQKFIQCDLCGKNSVFLCPFDEAFDGRRCSSDWSECDRLPVCKYDREAIVDPWDPSSYFLCVRKKTIHDKYYVFRRHCPHGETFDSYKKICYRKYYKPKPPCKRGCVSYNGSGFYDEE